MQKIGINQDKKQREIVENAEKEHPWPSEVGLSEDNSALNIFKKAQLQRSYKYWTPVDLIELARASKMIAMVDGEFETLCEEGVIVMGGRRGDTPIENPRGRAIATLNTSINAILRRLGVSALSSTEKKSSAIEGQAEREARVALAAVSSQAPEDGMSDADLLN